MFEISILKNKFVINQDGKKTSIPLSNLVYLDFHKNQYGDFYEIYGFFLSEDKLDGFDSYFKKYNEKIVHIFSGILDEYPFENINLSEYNPFSHVSNLIFISLNQEDKPNDIVKYINLDYLAGFKIFPDKRKMKDDMLFEVTLDSNLDVVKTQTQSLVPITYVELLLMNDENDESVSTSTQSFINALKNIKLQISSQQSKVTHWIDETLNLLERQLAFASNSLNKLNNMLLVK